MARDIKIAAMVDANLGDDEGGVIGANFAVTDLHGPDPSCGGFEAQGIAPWLRRVAVPGALPPDPRRICGKMKGLASCKQTGFLRGMAEPVLKSAPGLRYRLFLCAYGAAMALGEPLVWRYFRRRASGDAGYGAHLAERRGDGAPFQADLWVHAVSLGEFTSAEPVIRLALEAGHSVLVTHATPAGRRASEARLADAIAEGRAAVRFAPVDRPGYWRRFFALYAPKAALIMEVEFWPQMIEAARGAGCFLCLANSQVPSKSFPRAARLARLAGHPVAYAAAVFAKSDHIAGRFRALGAAPVLALGETRFDIPAAAGLVDAGQTLRDGRRVLTLASVVAGEEAVYLSLLNDLLAGDDAPLVIWVPRAPERFDDHTALLKQAGLRVARRSEVFDADLAPIARLDDVQVLVGDSLGEMFFYLAPADAVIVGGGFTEKGAHNVIEPLSLGKPVVTGPHIWTIEFPAIEAEAAGVLTVVQNEGQLTEVVRRAMTQGGPAAVAFHAANQGASARIFAAIRPMLEGA